MIRTNRKRSIRRSVAAGILASAPLLTLAAPVSAQSASVDPSYTVVVPPAPEASIQLIKEVEVAPGQYAEYKESPVGDTVNFQFTIVNDGTTPLTHVNLSDPSFPSCDRSSDDLGISASAPLAPGAHVVATCNVAVETTTINVAVANGTDGVTEVSDEDAAQVAVYALDIIKDVLNPETGAFESGVSLNVGDTASFRFTINNTGELDLWDVAVVDHLYSDCNREFGDIPAGGNAVYLCEFEVNETIINSATATGKAMGGAMANDTDYAGVYVRGINITKQVWNGADWADLATIAPGDDARYRITVQNTGSMDLRNVVVDDINFDQCDAPAGTINDLAAGEGWTYECEVSGITGDTTNVASVSATTVGNASGSFADLPVSDTDTADVTVVTPTTAAPTTAAPTTAAPTTAAPTTAAPTTAAPTTAAPTTAAPTTAAPPTTATPTTAAPGTSAPPTTKKVTPTTKKVSPTTAAPTTTIQVKTTVTAAPTTAAPTTAAPTTVAVRTLPKTGSGAVDTGLVGLGTVLMGSALVVTAKMAARREELGTEEF